MHDVNPQPISPARISAGTGWVAGASMVLVMTLVLGTSGPVFADELDERNRALKDETAEVQQSMDFLDADIAETMAQLRVHQDELPAVQQSLTDAQGKVTAAAGEVATLTQRVDLAQKTKNTITEQLKQDQEKMAGNREIIGQIASQAYKGGGLPSGISLLIGDEGPDDLTYSVEMLNQAFRNQNAAVYRLSQQDAINVNSAERLRAVEDEILNLQTQSEAALASEQKARDEAAVEKAKADDLIADTTALSEKLKAQKPIVQAQLAAIDAEQQQVIADIAERQRRLLEEARLREQARLKAQAEERARIEDERRAAEAAAANRPAPAPVPVQPADPIVAGNPSTFGLSQPVNGPITSTFGYRPTPAGTIDWAGAGGYAHTGIDYGVGCGTPIYAPASGEVWFADSGVLNGAGVRVVLNHGVDQGNALVTNYYHLESFAVSPGQQVSAGELIAYVGTSGNSSGCHLHFETQLNGSLVDPMSLF
ncbi:peptidoglycan DD-metalloendopeptidase family protein [Arthrobacter sp. 260]|nr:peptidoglycan DD-metalloendopeptidase family protein [Arthrobacter sp. 260]